MSADRQHVIYLVSDGTCRTCETVVQAVLVQFDPKGVHLIRKPNVRRPETVTNLIVKAKEDGALVFYTLVYDRAREAIKEAAQQYQVRTVDLLEPVLVSLYDLFKSSKRAKPGILYKSNRAQYDRIDAVEYTLHHDDGCAAHELADADVVLVGVSRVCKSTTCFYLAYSGIRAANVPLFDDCEPPPELPRIDPRRVIGLSVNPYRLQSIRDTRLRGWGMSPHEEYADKRRIASELRSANEQMAKYGWRCIDTSYKAVEEIAREVLQVLDESGVKVGQRRDAPR